MRINFSETKAKFEGFEIYSYHSSISPLNGARHDVVTAYLLYMALKDDYVVTFIGCLGFVRGSKTVQIKRR